MVSKKFGTRDESSCPADEIVLSSCPDRPDVFYVDAVEKLV